MDKTIELEKDITDTKETMFKEMNKIVSLLVDIMYKGINKLEEMEKEPKTNLNNKIEKIKDEIERFILDINVAITALEGQLGNG